MATKVNFYLKEVISSDDEENNSEEEITISVIKRVKSGKSQTLNTKMLDDLSAIEQQSIKGVVAILEKYLSENEGAKDMKYSL